MNRGEVEEIGRDKPPMLGNANKMDKEVEGWKKSGVLDNLSC